MPKRSFAMAIAMALFASLALSAPSQAGSYITTLTALNASGKAADDFEAIFTGTGGTISNLTVQYSSGVLTTTKLISGGTGIEVDFSTPLPNNTGALVLTFTNTNSSNIQFSSAVWTFKSGAPINADMVHIATTPEPASMALLGIGMAGFFSFRRFFNKRRAVV